MPTSKCCRIQILNLIEKHETDRFLQPGHSTRTIPLSYARFVNVWVDRSWHSPAVHVKVRESRGSRTSSLISEDVARADGAAVSGAFAKGCEAFQLARLTDKLRVHDRRVWLILLNGVARGAAEEMRSLPLADGRERRESVAASIRGQVRVLKTTLHNLSLQILTVEKKMW